MSLLADLNAILDGLGVPVETGIFSGVPPAEYAVLTPLADTFGCHADNRPQTDIQEVRISLYTKGNYRRRVRQLTNALFNAEIAVTERRYNGFDAVSKMHGYTTDVQNYYNLEV